MIILRISLLLAAFAVTAICLMPLRFAWAAADAPAGLRVDGVRGTIWSGQLSGVTWRGVALGDLAITSSALTRPGDIVITAQSETGPLRSAAISLSSRGSTLEDISAVVGLSSVVPGAPTEARLTLEDGNITLQDDQCVSASGRIATDAVVAQGVPAFQGELTCFDGQFSATAASVDGLHRLTVRIGMSGEATRPVVTEASAATQVWLAALGIPVASPGGGQ